MPQQVLIVDDDEYVCQTLSVYLAEEGYTVYCATSGEEALHLLHQLPIQVVVSDLWMRGITGLELLSRVHQIDPNFPVILLTGSASLSTSIDAVNQGASAYLLKPLSLDEVRAAVARSLEKSDQTPHRHGDYPLFSAYQDETKDSLSPQDEPDQVRNGQTIALISDLMRGLRHELGNLTTVLNLDMSLLEQAISGPGIDQARLDELKYNLSDLERLLARLKTYPQPGMHMAPVNLRQILYDAMEQAERQMHGAPIALKCDASADEVWINGDESGLRRVIINILDNALEASRKNKGEAVGISLVREQESVIVTVTDSGGGFDPEMLNAPFSPAYTTKITDGFLRGLGLGLFVSHAIVSLHGGTITLQNQAEGGAQVIIRLPLLSENAKLRGDEHSNFGTGR